MPFMTRLDRPLAYDAARHPVRYFVVTCPHCDKTFKVALKAGVRCPACDHAFVVTIVKPAAKEEPDAGGD